MDDDPNRRGSFPPRSQWGHLIPPSLARPHEIDGSREKEEELLQAVINYAGFFGLLATVLFLESIKEFSFLLFAGSVIGRGIPCLRDIREELRLNVHFV